MGKNIKLFALNYNSSICEDIIDPLQQYLKSKGIYMQVITLMKTSDPSVLTLEGVEKELTFRRLRAPRHLKDIVEKNDFDVIAFDVCEISEVNREGYFCESDEKIQELLKQNASVLNKESVIMYRNMYNLLSKESHDLVRKYLPRLTIAASIDAIVGNGKSKDSTLSAYTLKDRLYEIISTKGGK